MKTFKELREIMTRGFGVGPVDTFKPMASMGGSQHFPNSRYSTTLPQLTATYQGAGVGTIKPMLSAKKQLNAISNKLKSKVLDRKIKRAKVKFYKGLKPKGLFTEKD